MSAKVLALLGGLLASGEARAHYPHDMATWVAVSPDPEEPRLATSLERIDLDVLGRSEDGLAWAARLVGAAADVRTCAGAFLTTRRLALATDGRGLLVSEDAGDTLAPAPDVTDATVVRVVAADGLAFAAGESAIWRSTDAGLTWAPVLGARGAGFTDLDVAPDFTEDGRLCALEGLTVACSADAGETWTRSATPAEAYRVAVGAGGRVWLAARGGGLVLSPDDSATWEEEAFPGTDLVAVAEFADDLVVAAEAERALWRSADGGATWDFVDLLTIPFDQSRDGVNFFGFFEGPEGALYAGTWFGLARSGDRGLTWGFYDTEPIQNTHAVSLTRAEGGALAAWIGTYGGGPLLVDLDTLATRTFPALRRRFTRDAPVTPDWQRDGTAIFDEGYSTWRTTDHGERWDRIAQDPREGGTVELDDDVKGVALSPDPAADPFLLSINGQTAMNFQVSEDLGDTWITGEEDPRCADDGFAVALSPRWPDEARAWAACGGAVYESLDRGRTWTVLGDTGASFVFRIVERDDGALLVAASDGLWRVDAGDVERIAFPGAVVVSVAADGETFFALVPAEGWYRSEDGGETWEALAAPTADMPRMVALSPDFQDDGTVAVAGYGGAWVSRDRGETWASIYAREVYETAHDAWATTGAWTDESWDDASGRTVTLTREAGASKTLRFQGIAAALEAPVTAEPGAVAVSLDGAAPVHVVFPVSRRAIWRTDDLDDAWHTLRVEALAGTVRLDALRISRLPAEPADTGGEPEAHGCATGPPGPLAALPLALAWRRRRRR